MADVCIVYGSEDEQAARSLFEVLSTQWDVWWDDTLTGDYSKKIPKEIKNCRCVVALWSRAACEKTATVGEDMRIARENGVEIIPASLEPCDAMYTFGNLSRVDLHEWDGSPSHQGIQKLQRKIATLVAPRTKPLRLASLARGRVPLPAIFLSISSHETRLEPVPAMQAVRLFEAPLVLISAYDTHPAKNPDIMIDELRRYRESGGFVLMDSGNYEAHRRSDTKWSPRRLAEALQHTPHDWAFCFDVMPPPSDISTAADQVVAAVERDQEYSSAPILPIVHAPVADDGSYFSETAPEVIRRVAERLSPPMIAIPERELGAGIFERATTVRKIRAALETLPFYQPLHLLGTGNPWTIAILAAAGADSFDGLEWCRVVVDHESGRLHHDQHLDFFSFQGRRGDSRIAAAALGDPEINFAGKAAFHNLAYYSGFADELQEAAKKGDFEAFVMATLGNKAHVVALKKQMPELFN